MAHVVNHEIFSLEAKAQPGYRFSMSVREIQEAREHFKPFGLNLASGRTPPVITPD